MKRRKPLKSSRRKRLLRVITVLYDCGAWWITPTGWVSTYRYALKSDAVKIARNYAKRHARPELGISLRIKSKDGRHTEERTYPRSADPRRSKG